MERELIIVDDQSNDGTWTLLERLATAHPEIRLFRHEVNRGKGAAVRTAIQQATGDFSIIQDADLEYDPVEYPILVRPLLDGRAVQAEAYAEDVVAGFRDTYRLLLKHRGELLSNAGPLAVFQRAESRFLMRNTRPFSFQCRASIPINIVKQFTAKTVCGNKL